MTTIHPIDDWHPIATAPRDGTEVELTWMEDGQPQEVWTMRWQLFRVGCKGIWAMHGKTSGALLCTWTEEDPSEGPTHWRVKNGG